MRGQRIAAWPITLWLPRLAPVRHRGGYHQAKEDSMSNLISRAGRSEQPDRSDARKRETA